MLRLHWPFQALACQQGSVRLDTVSCASENSTWDVLGRAVPIWPWLKHRTAWYGSTPQRTGSTCSLHHALVPMPVVENCKYEFTVNQRQRGLMRRHLLSYQTHSIKRTSWQVTAEQIENTMLFPLVGSQLLFSCPRLLIWHLTLTTPTKS